MPTVNLIKGPDNKLTGLTERDTKAYAKFKTRVEELDGSILTFTWKEPRSGKYNARHFVMLNALFEHQEQFADPRQFRKWLEVGAGYCDFVPGPNGRMVALEKSIDYDTLDQLEFQPIHEAVVAFARSAHATKFLWPHLSDQQAWDMMGSILDEFF